MRKQKDSKAEEKREESGKKRKGGKKVRSARESSRGGRS